MIYIKANPNASCIHFNLLTTIVVEYPCPSLKATDNCWFCLVQLDLILAWLRHAIPNLVLVYLCT